MGKIKAFINRHKSALAVSAVSASLMVSSALSAFAADGDTTVSDVQTAFSTGIQNISSQLMSYLGITILAVIGVVGAYFSIRKAISFFLKLCRKD